LPLVYEELRKLAAQKLAEEKPGQTLQATAPVHEANLRLVDTEKVQHWNSRGHFFADVEAVAFVVRLGIGLWRAEKPPHVREQDWDDARTGACS
jgi:hypothetical protein